MLTQGLWWVWSWVQWGGDRQPAFKGQELSVPLRSLSFVSPVPFNSPFQTAPQATTKGPALTYFRAQTPFHGPEQRPVSSLPWLFPSSYIYAVSKFCPFASQISCESITSLRAVTHFLNSGHHYVLCVCRKGPFSTGAPLHNGASNCSHRQIWSCYPLLKIPCCPHLEKEMPVLF